jgi:adenine phosphoribosyltransferase
VTDFPKPGIIFKDLTTLFNDSEAFEYVIDVLAAKYEPLAPTYVAAIEARGFILGAPLAYKLGVGFIPIRKPGKLPAAVHRFSYDLEYGSDAVEIHQDAAKNGERVVLVDDLLATGGTANAAYQLLKGIGSEVVGIGFVTELGFLPGRARLPADIDIFSLITY